VASVRICVFEEGFSQLLPLTWTRPTFALLCGAVSLLERQQRYFVAAEVGAVVRRELLDLCRSSLPGVRLNDPAWLRGAAREGLVLVHGRWLPPPGSRWPTAPEVGLVGDTRQMFTTASTAMARRGRTWTAAHADFFLGLYERTAGERQELLREQSAEGEKGVEIRPCRSRAGSARRRRN
jgi:hypothetical protein